MNEKIIVNIDGDKVSIEVEGVEDSSCHDLTQKLEEALGVVISKKEKDHQQISERKRVKLRE